MEARTVNRVGSCHGSTQPEKGSKVYRLGVLHNICEAVSEKCGEERDQVGVLGFPVEDRFLHHMDSASGAAAVIYFHFWKYMSNSEAASISWVYEPLCEERKGSAMILVAIQHVDYGNAEDGYCGHYEDHHEETPHEDPPKFET